MLTPGTGEAQRRRLPLRMRRRTGMLLLVGAVAIFGGALAYAYFSSTGSGTGTVAVGTLSAPVVTPSGAPAFNVGGIVGGDSTSLPASVQVVGGLPTRVSLYAKNTTGALLSQLNLTVVQDGSTTVYNGPLSGFATAASPLALTGTGTNGWWPVGETHSFVFTVSAPLSLGNAFQNTTAQLNFVWLREQL